MKFLVRASLTLAGLILLGRLQAQAANSLNPVWCNLLADAKSDGAARANAVAVDNSGHVFVVGEDGGDLWIGSLQSVESNNEYVQNLGCNTNPPGSPAAPPYNWTGPASVIQGIGYSVALNPANSHLYVLASIAPSSSCWIADLDPLTGGSVAVAGWTPQWAPHTVPGCYVGPYIFSSGNNPPRGALRVDPSGNIWIGGWTDTTTATMQVLELDATGYPAVQAYNVSAAGNMHGFQDLAFDPAGNPYMISGQGPGFYVNGPYAWTASPQPIWDFFNPSNLLAAFSDDRQVSLVVNQSSNVIAGGQFVDSGGGGFWMYSFPQSYVKGSPTPPPAQYFYPTAFLQTLSPPVNIGAFHDMALVPSGAAICGGSLFTVGSQGWVGRFIPANGNFAESYSDPNVDSFEGVAVDNAGNVYAVGDGLAGGIYVAAYNSSCVSSNVCGDVNCAANQPVPVTNTILCQAYNYPNPFQRRSGLTTLYWELPQSLTTTVTIRDLLGNQVRQWIFQQNQNGGFAGPNRITWDGTNDHGKQVIQGQYVGYVTTSGDVCDVTFRIGVL